MTLTFTVPIPHPNPGCFFSVSDTSCISTSSMCCDISWQMGIVVAVSGAVVSMFSIGEFISYVCVCGLCSCIDIFWCMSCHMAMHSLTQRHEYYFNIDLDSSIHVWESHCTVTDSSYCFRTRWAAAVLWSFYRKHGFTGFGILVAYVFIFLFH